MNRNKFVFLFVLLLSCLIVFSSCNKKEGESDNKSVASSIISSESKSSREPVVVVPSPLKSDSSDKTESTPVVKGEIVSEVTLPDTEEEAALSEESVAFEEEPETAVVYVSSPEDDDYVYAASFSYKGIVSTVTASSTTAEITIPEGVTSDVLNQAISSLVEAYPVLKDYVTYSFLDGTVVLEYPALDKAVVEDYIDTLFKEAEYYINFVLASDNDETSDVTEKEIVVVALDNGENESEKKEDVKEEKVASPSPLVKESTANETKKKALPLSASLSLFGGYDLSAKKITGGLKVGVDYTVFDKLSFGVNFALGYQSGLYFPVYGSVKYNFFDNLYASLGVGYTYNMKDKSQSSLLVAAFLGYSCNLSEKLALSVEGGAMYYPLLSNKVVPSLIIGAKYNF